jgi:hypothetical protein
MRREVKNSRTDLTDTTTLTGPHPSNGTEMHKGESKHGKNLNIKNGSRSFGFQREHTDLGWLGSGVSRSRVAGPCAARSSCRRRARRVPESACRCRCPPRRPPPASPARHQSSTHAASQPRTLPLRVQPRPAAATASGTWTGRRERSGTPLWLLHAAPPPPWKHLLRTGRGRRHGHLPPQCPPSLPCERSSALLVWLVSSFRFLVCWLWPRNEEEDRQEETPTLVQQACFLSPVTTRTL